ncbi:MAG TPA: gentisate 1,2-dioxygenase [Burkholderiales bacterium]|nr:gentisate 1,2-dioxygenase [Burkholderiales bacterium]
MQQPASAHAEREAFYKRIDPQNLAPLWEARKNVPPHPSSPCVPALWRYAEVQPHLMRACELITAREAERRVLVLENPGLRGSSFITKSLYAGLQAILPGEIAPSHRHTANALRFVIEGDGAYTAVEGERTTMRPGDFVVTPSWAWHDHGNLGSGPVVWLDGLDTAIVWLFDAAFRENYPEESQPLARAEGSAAARYGSNLLPVDYESKSRSSPLLSYPYARSRDTLAALARSEDAHPSHGFKLRFVNPATGGDAFPTIAAFMQLLPAGFGGKPYRSTDGAVFSVAEGRGRVTVGAQTFEFARHDTFVIPSWHAYSFAAPEDCVLFSFSDRAAQHALGIWREQYD